MEPGKGAPCCPNAMKGSLRPSKATNGSLRPGKIWRPVLWVLAIAYFLIDAISASLLKPLRQWLDKQGLEPLGQGPEAFAAYIAKDRERWAKVVKAGDI